MTDQQPADWQSTACILCECNCGIVVQTEGRTLAKIRGDKEHPGTRGYTCNKALRLDHYQNNRARLTSPMRRRADGSYEEIDWDTAIAEIADGFKAIRDNHGGDKVLYYGGGGQGNHLGGAYSGAFLKAIGSRYRSSALAQEKTGEAWVDAHLYGCHTRGEFEHAEVSVFVGKNPWMSQSFPRARVVLNEIAKDPARSMIVIDPVVTDTAKMTDFHLRVRPGADAWCLAALAALVLFLWYRMTFTLAPNPTPLIRAGHALTRTLHALTMVLALLALFPVAMLAGAASMLPGGLGSTEAILIALLTFSGAALAPASLAAVGIRLATLWLATVMGMAAFGWLEWRRARA